MSYLDSIKFLLKERNWYLRQAELAAAAGAPGEAMYQRHMNVAWTYHQQGLAAGGREDPDIAARFVEWRLTR